MRLGFLLCIVGNFLSENGLKLVRVLCIFRDVGRWIF